jgi:hypothetical protein
MFISLCVQIDCCDLHPHLMMRFSNELNLPLVFPLSERLVHRRLTPHKTLTNRLRDPSSSIDRQNGHCYTSPVCSLQLLFLRPSIPPFFPKVKHSTASTTSLHQYHFTSLFHLLCHSTCHSSPLIHHQFRLRRPPKSRNIIL